VSASFAMLASRDWRAALLLWRTYRDWKIWLWEREEADLLEGVASLGRHLVAGDLPWVIEEIREGLDRGFQWLDGIEDGRFFLGSRGLCRSIG
jgi:hypothetical protein